MDLVGDDAAVLPSLAIPVVTTDSYAEGRHFHRWWCDPEVLGRRLLEATLSDLAAMGASPAFVFCAVMLPGSTDHEWVERFHLGLCSRSDCVLAGGETIAGDCLCVTLTAVGEGGSEPLLRRSSARPGDRVWITGPVGRTLDSVSLLERCRGTSGPGLAPVLPLTPEEAAHVGLFLQPRAAFGEARVLRARGVLCAVDVSDGVLSEAARISEESGVGIELDLDRVPLLPLAASRALEACAAGEDFVLLFTAGAGEDFSGEGFSAVGRAAGHPGLRVVSGGVPVGIVSAGYDHFA